jgi:hypothetical protein
MGIVKLTGCDRKSNGSGDPPGLSRNRIIQLAIIRHATAAGIALAKASAAALQFSDAGQTGRRAGELFATGKTLLILSDKLPVVINSDFDSNLASLSGGISIIVVDLNKIVDQVDAALNS